ncbi:hypothetical protein IAR55_000677 [Kwoniella newhampshirensis]|uniref:Zn(2)-C6 fungal-type domain-containing protein n=1 Tax=Kwoniella newhampshirensis TaxID=1651941 RepID=A0AAW0Z7B1_9TREE
MQGSSRSLLLGRPFDILIRLYQMSSLKSDMFWARSQVVSQSPPFMSTSVDSTADMSWAGSKAPCASCARVKVRCVWDADEMMCERCSSHPAGVCPLPPRSAFRSAYKRQRPSPSSTLTVVSPRSSSRALQSALDHQSRQVLAGQGRSRLAAVEVDFIDMALKACAADVISDSLLNFATVILSVSGLKFCNFIVSLLWSSPATGVSLTYAIRLTSNTLPPRLTHQLQNDNLVPSAGQILPIEKVTKTQWMDRMYPKGSVQEDALRTMLYTHFNMLEDLTLSTFTSTEDLIFLLSCLRTAAKVIGRSGTKEYNETLRHVEAWAVALAALHLQKVPIDEGKRNLLWRNAFQVAVSLNVTYDADARKMYEAQMSILLGVPSLIKPECFAMLRIPLPPPPPSLDIGLEELEPLLCLDDGYHRSDPRVYFWDHLSRNAAENIHWIARQRSLLPPEYRGTPVDYDIAFSRIDDIYLWVDAIGHAIKTSTRRTFNKVYSKRALDVLRSLLCLELCTVMIDIQSICPAQKYADFDPKLKQRLQERACNAWQRTSRGLELITSHDPPLSEMYHVTDLVLSICELLGDALPETLQLTEQSSRKLIIDCVQIGKYWDCGAIRLAKKLNV